MSNLIQKKGLNTCQIKIIALLFMVIDHIAAFFPSFPIYFRYFGRLSAPLYLFVLVWGMDYTHNRKKYIFRLYFSSISLEILWFFLEFFISSPLNSHYNIFLTYFIIAILIELFFPTRNDRSIPKSIFLIVIWQGFSFLIIFISSFLPYDLSYFFIALSGNIVYNEWGLFGCILGLLLYYFKNNTKLLIISYATACLYYVVISVTALYARLAYFTAYHFGSIIGNFFKFFCIIMTGKHPAFTPLVLHGLYLGDYQWFMIGALPIMLLYNNQQGAPLKIFFYLFYPLHLVFLLIISNYL